jgi:hypothetical protein
MNTGGNPRGFGFPVSLGALALAFGLTGCVTSDIASKTIGIDSDPPGVRVEVNGEYLGRTPTTYTVRPNKKGDFAGGWGDTPSVVFVAFPPEDGDGLYKQTKSFSPSGFMETGDRVPAQIFFDLHRSAGR